MIDSWEVRYDANVTLEAWDKVLLILGVKLFDGKQIGLDRSKTTERLATYQIRYRERIPNFCR